MIQYFKLKKIIFFFVGLLGTATLVYAQSESIKFVEYDLDNGMHVILHKDVQTPIVEVSVLYHVGSKNDPSKRKGFAHFFEHLLFEGSENIKRGEYFKIIQEAGGASNAYTTFDYTYYYNKLPVNQLALGLYMESERLLHAKIEPIGVETQREVVKEEKRQSYDNRPYGSFWIEVFKRVFQRHPYHFTPIGLMEDLNAASLDEFIDFYKTYYVPNNATLTIAGDIDIDSTRMLIDRYFSEIPKGLKLIYRPQIAEPYLKDEMVDTVYDHIQLPAVYQVYRIPKMTQKDAYPLQILSQLLTGGESAVLRKSLVDQQQKASSIFSFPYLLEDAGIFGIGGFSNPGIRIDALHQAIDVALENVKAAAIAPKTLQKLQNQIENDLVDTRRSIHRVAEELALGHIFFKNTNHVNTELNTYRKVTAADIQRVAQKYLNPENRVVLYYLPKPSDTQVKEQ